MSAILRRDQFDVLLRYETDVALRPAAARGSDRERQLILRAERELRVIELIHEHLEISDAGRARLWDALRTIQTALQVQRQAVGLKVVRSGR